MNLNEFKLFLDILNIRHQYFKNAIQLKKSLVWLTNLKVECYIIHILEWGNYGRDVGKGTKRGGGGGGWGITIQHKKE